MEKEKKVKKEKSELETIKGIGEESASKLEKKGFHTIESIATATLRDLDDASIGEATAKKILEEARRKFRPRYINGLEYKKLREKNIKKLTTGSLALDELLQGGLETKTITEFYGEYGSGKSIMAHQFSVLAQLPEEQGGLNGKVLYVDTEGTYMPKWIDRFAERFKLDVDKTHQNIIKAECETSDEQIDAINKADYMIKNEGVKLIVVDSITAKFRAEYIGRDTLNVRQQTLNKHIDRLSKVIGIFNACAVITNQVMDKPDLFSYTPDPIGGHILGHASHTRFYLRKCGRKIGVDKRIFQLTTHNYIQEAERVLWLKYDYGFCDTEEELKRRADEEKKKEEQKDERT